MKAEQVKITSVEQLAQMLKDAKCGGQFITINVLKAAEMNVFPTDGSEKIRRNPDFAVFESYGVQAHYTEDYEKKMAKALGVENYEAHANNRVHIVKNALMQYTTTGNICFIYLPTDYLNYRLVGANGEPLSAKEIAYYERYKKPKSKGGIIEYRNVGIANIKSIAMGGKLYVLEIPKESYLTQAQSVAKAA
jgi:hypothetical protein